jgi:hypothetical protein
MTHKEQYKKTVETAVKRAVSSIVNKGGSYEAALARLTNKYTYVRPEVMAMGIEFNRQQIIKSKMI